MLKHALQNESRQGDEKDTSVKDAVIEDFSFRSHPAGEVRKKEISGNGKHEAGTGCCRHDEGKDTVRFFTAPFPHDFGDEGASSRTEHEPDTAENHDGGINQIDGGESGFAHEI